MIKTPMTSGMKTQDSAEKPWTQDLESRYEALKDKVLLSLGGLSFHTLDQADCRRIYIAYLLESYAYVSHTSRLLALAASRLEESHSSVRSFLFRHAVAEDRHHHMILRDLKTLSVTVEDAQRYQPSVTCQSLLGYVYHVAAHENAVGVLGDAYFLEQMSLNSADGFANLVMSRCGLTEKSVTFMRNHGKLDVEHVKSLQRVFNWVKQREDQACILQVMQTVGTLYAQMMAGLGSIADPRGATDDPVEAMVLPSAPILVAG